MSLRKSVLLAVLAASLSMAQSQSVGDSAQDQQPPASQTPAQTPPPAAAPAPPVWSIGPIDFSGLIDVYADKNFNNPASRTNGLANFAVKANQFSLNMAKLTMEHTADPVGFRVDFGFGLRSSRCGRAEQRRAEMG